MPKVIEWPACETEDLRIDGIFVSREKSEQTHAIDERNGRRYAARNNRFYEIRSAPRVQPQKDYHLVGFRGDTAEVHFVHSGMKLISEQRTYARAEHVARQIAESIFSMFGNRAADILKAAESSDPAFADLIAAIGTVPLDHAKTTIATYLKELRAGNDSQLALAAEDALDQLDFSGE